MDNTALSSVKIEQPEVYLEHPDVHSFATDAVTEDDVFDKVDCKVPTFVKIEQSELDLEHPEINSSSQSYPSITRQEHPQVDMNHVTDFKKQYLSDTDMMTSDSFQEMTGKSNTEQRKTENDYKESFKLEQYNEISENISSFVKVNKNPSLTSENLHFPNKETGVKHTQISGGSNYSTVDMPSGDPQAQNMSDGCDLSITTNIKIHRVEASDKLSTCDVDCLKPDKTDDCGVSFTQARNQKTHKRTHTGDKLFQCDVCGCSFIQLRYLKSHKRTHTGEKSYKCDVCGASFTHASSLNIHKRTHTGEKPYHCDVCDVSFTHAATLNFHKRTHTGEKPYKCDVCGCSFIRSDYLKSHKRTHTGEKPYKCDVCSASFTRSNSMNFHKRAHTGEKPYKCDECGCSFIRPDYLKSHKRTHTGEKPYKCDVCCASFTQGSTLSFHKRTHRRNTLLV